ncbi:MAG: hypothetical protein ACNS60_11490 [Candidatus Cyclobacteriaceae bacterium M2_1C_046]
MEGKAENKFKDLGKKIDEMMNDLAELRESMKTKYGDRWEEVNRNKNKLESELNEFRERNKDRFDEAERSMEKAGTEIKKAFEAIFAKKPAPERDTGNPSTGEKASEH